MDSWDFHYLQRGQQGYEEARQKAVWNGHVPERYPDWIVYPENASQAQKIVYFAKASGLSIGVKSGGHSWSAAFLRDGGILVDLVKMNDFTIDVNNKTAIVEPAAYASKLNDTLLEHNLMFPGGHCPTIGMGGYLLQGGLGWNSHKFGLACESVLAIELITADGDLIRADPDNHADYFWAARGAGCGYFGLITSFHLQLKPLPAGIMTARYMFEVADLDEVAIAIDNISDRISPDLEVCLFVSYDQDGFTGRPTIAITMDAFSDTIEMARASIQILHDLPTFRKAIKAYEFIPCTLKQMMQRMDFLLDNRGLNYQVDNMWTEAPVTKLLPSFHEIIQDLPPAPAHLFMTWWPQRPRPDMAFSMEARLYVAMYVISADSSTNSTHAKYVRKSMSLMTEHEKGIQLGDENLPSHPGKFMATSNFVQLEHFRQKYDPAGVFHGYYRLPDEFRRLQASI